MNKNIIVYSDIKKKKKKKKNSRPPSPRTVVAFNAGLVTSEKHIFLGAE